MTSIIVVSHSEKIAVGIVELTKEMAPNADIYACGGTDDNLLGTSLNKIMSTIKSIPEEHDILILYDIGSSYMSAESAIDFLDLQERVKIVKAALVEGSLIASVSAELEKNITEIIEDLKPVMIEK